MSARSNPSDAMDLAESRGPRRGAWLRRAALVSMLAALVSGCSGQSATIELAITSAPGSDIMDQVVRVRLTLSDPVMVVEDERAPGGTFDLAFDLPASGGLATVTLEGFDASGALIAFGRTLPLPLALLDAEVGLFVAPPLSITEAPVALQTARSDMGVAALAFGAVIAGGRESDGSLSSELHIYNGFAHDFQAGEELPAARATLTPMVGATEYLYFFGGQDSSGDDSATGWRFSLNVPPRGAYSTLTSAENQARSGARAAAQQGDVFVITGDPTLRLDGLTSQVAEYPGAPVLAGTATTLVLDNEFYALFVGSGNQDAFGHVLVDGVFTALGNPALNRIGHATVALADGTALTLGGERSGTGFLDTDGVVVDVRSLEVEVVPDLLVTPRRDLAAAATSEFIVIAGGVDGAGEVVTDAEILDVETLARVATLPMVVPRTQASAVALPNGQVLIVGGLDAAGRPISELELFTPRP